jgi:uncharacterized membrane protein
MDGTNSSPMRISLPHLASNYTAALPNVSSNHTGPHSGASNDLDFLGIGIGVCGSVFINVGNNLVAMSAAPPERPKLARVGWLVFALGTLSVFAAFAFAAAAVVAPLETLQFVVNLLFNHVVNSMKITWSMIVGTGLILLGTFFVVANGPTESDVNTPLATLEGYWTSYAWLAWVGTIVAVSLASDFVHQYYLTHLDDAAASLFRPEIVLPLSYALASAPIGTQVQVILRTSRTGPTTRPSTANLRAVLRLRLRMERTRSLKAAAACR